MISKIPRFHVHRVGSLVYCWYHIIVCARVSRSIHANTKKSLIHQLFGHFIFNIQMHINIIFFRPDNRSGTFNFFNITSIQIQKKFRPPYPNMIFVYVFWGTKHKNRILFFFFYFLSSIFFVYISCFN